MHRNPHQYLVEQNQCNVNNYQQTIGATGVFIVTSAQLSRNGRMKHEAMPDYASYDVKLPKSIADDCLDKSKDYTVCFRAGEGSLI